MKAKAACIGTPKSVVDALSSTSFAFYVISRVIGGSLGVKDALNHPAEYYVQLADEGAAPKEGTMGVEVRLTGVSRNGRTAKQFHDALNELVRIVRDTIKCVLPLGQRCQIFCVIMLDGEVETFPGSGAYSNSLESQAEWVIGESCA